VEEASMKKVTPEELEKATGKDDEPALVAVDGKVYDVTSSGMWTAGNHMGAHQAGRDLSAEIQAAPHGADVLERFEQVGEIEEAPAAPASSYVSPPALVSAILARHPHPVSVHFPIALSIVGAIFMGLGLALDCESLEQAGFYNVVCAALASPGAIGAGFLSWWYNYGRTWTPIFRKKILLSVLFQVLVTGAVLIRLLLPVQDPTWHWMYVGLVAVLPPVALGLGYLGGQITFPS
jgi:predicted heme/steroid binding protein/uncharacterized membrane protein